MFCSHALQTCSVAVIVFYSHVLQQYSIAMFYRRVLKLCSIAMSYSAAKFSNRVLQQCSIACSVTMSFSHSCIRVLQACPEAVFAAVLGSATGSTSHVGTV